MKKDTKKTSRIEKKSEIPQPQTQHDPIPAQPETKTEEIIEEKTETVHEDFPKDTP